MRCGPVRDILCQIQMVEDIGEAVEALNIWD